MPEFLTPNAKKDLVSSVKRSQQKPERRGSSQPPIPKVISSMDTNRNTASWVKEKKPLNTDISEEIKGAERFVDANKFLVVNTKYNHSKYEKRASESFFANAKNSLKNLVNSSPLRDWFADFNYDRQLKKLQKTGLTLEQAAHQLNKQIEKDLDAKYGKEEEDEYPVDQGTAKSHGVSPEIYTRNSKHADQAEQPRIVEISQKEIKKVIDLGFPQDEDTQKELYRSRFSQMIANDSEAQAKIANISNQDAISLEDAESRYIAQALSNISQLPKSALYQKIFSQSINTEDAKLLVEKKLEEALTLDSGEETIKTSKAVDSLHKTPTQRKTDQINREMARKQSEFQFGGNLEHYNIIDERKKNNTKVPESASEKLSTSEKLKIFKKDLTKNSKLDMYSPESVNYYLNQYEDLKSQSNTNFEVSIRFQNDSNSLLAQLNEQMNKQVHNKEQAMQRANFVRDIVPTLGKHGIISNLSNRGSNESVVFQDLNAYSVAETSLDLLLNEKDSAEFNDLLSRYLITFLRPQKTSLNEQDFNIEVNGQDVIFPSQFAQNEMGNKYHDLAARLYNAVHKPSS